MKKIKIKKFLPGQGKLKIMNKGYLLVEAMIAIGILVIGMLGILGLISQSVSLNRLIGDRIVANYLAMEGIEIVKNIIDANYLEGGSWNDGISNGNSVDYNSAQLENYTNFLKFDSTTSRYGYDDGENTPFSRTIEIVQIDGNNDEIIEEIKVNSIVEWTGRGGLKGEINLEDHFFNWRP